MRKQCVLLLAVVATLSSGPAALAEGGSGSGGTGNSPAPQTGQCYAPQSTKSNWTLTAGGEGTGSGSGGVSIDTCTGQSVSFGGGSS